MKDVQGPIAYMVYINIYSYKKICLILLRDKSTLVPGGFYFYHKDADKEVLSLGKPMLVV